MKIRPGLVLALVLAMVAAAYLGALAVGFVWDDRALVLPHVPSASAAPVAAGGDASTSLGAVVSRPFWGDSTADDPIAPYFRPVTSASFALDRLVFGDTAAGFHVTSILLHLVACGLLFAVCRRCGASPIASVLAALALGADARLTECVTWISGRTDVLAADFALAGVLAWPRAGPRPDAPRESIDLPRRGLAALLFALAFLAKETALAAPLALMIAEWPSPLTPAHTSTRGSAHAFARAWAPVLAAFVVVLVLRSLALAHAAPSVNAFSWPDRALASVEAVGRYAFLLAVPWLPQLQIGLVSVHAWGFVALGAVLLLLAVVVALGSSRLHRLLGAPLVSGERLGLALAAFALAAVVPLGPARISVVAADRFLYLPLVGLALALAVAANRLQRRARSIGAAALVTAFALSSLAVVPQRNALWADELRLWLATCETASAADTIPLTALGATLFRGDAYADAARVDLVAAERSAGDERTRSLLRAATAAARAGDLRRARDLLVGPAHRPEATPRLLDRLARVELALGSESDRAAARRDAAAAEQLGFARTPPSTSLTALIDETDAETRALAALPPSTAKTVRQARLAARTDRRRDAREAWSRALHDPALDADTVHEAVVTLVRDGDVETLASDAATLQLLGSRAPHDPLLGPLTSLLTTRAAFAREIETLRPRLAPFETLP